MSMEKLFVQALEQGVTEGVFPGAQLWISHRGREIFSRAVGYAALLPEKKPLTLETVFDISSLTKIFATTYSYMLLSEQGRIALEEEIGAFSPIFAIASWRRVTLKQLFSHCAGLPAWRPYFRMIPWGDPQGKDLIRKILLNEEPVYPPGTRSLYCDLGFMLLEWVMELTTGVSLNDTVERNIYRPLGLAKTGYRLLDALPLTPANPEGIAATEDCPWRGRIMVGEVHDENAWAMGGVAGHAGLFATAKEVGRLIHLLPGSGGQERPEIFSHRRAEEFMRPQNIPGSTYALGFDMPSPQGSQAGTLFSRNAVGHLGFTGCSFWLDKEHELAVVLLSNRVHPTRENERIRAFRPYLHDLVYREIIG